MKLREYFRKRRQRKAHKRYEAQKARNEIANDPKAMDRVADHLADMGGE
jgi:hypothetical protein